MEDRHVVSLELSKKLKEAGYLQEGEFWWKITPKKFNGKYAIDFGFSIATEGEFVAPLASELMERLPDNIGEFEFYLLKDGRGYLVGYCIDEACGDHEVLHQEKYAEKENPIPFIDTNLPNALAKMYIYLAEHHLLGGKG